MTPVGMLLLVPEHNAEVVLKPGRTVHDDERLNVLAIGVRESDRGRGVNLAMASYGYLELVRRGAKYLSYTLVLDDNWPSRRTAEKLGAFVCANYVAYRRNFLSKDNKDKGKRIQQKNTKQLLSVSPLSLFPFSIDS